MTTLLFLDDYHVGDPLFLADLGRRLSKLGSGGRTLIVHRATEVVERNLESADSSESDVVAERSIREANQGITRRLIEEGVPAVSVQGSDRRLLQISDSVQVGSGKWLMRMIETGSVGVVSPLAAAENGPRPVDAVDAALAIARLAAGQGEVQGALFCSTRKEGLIKDGARLDEIAIDRLSEHADVIDVEAATRLAGEVDRLVATNSVGPAKGPIIPGTLIRPS